MNRENYLKLVQELIEHDRHYYEEARPFISDYEYDQKMRQLMEAEREHPDWVVEDSPSQRVTEAPAKGFLQREHLVPMYSLDNTYSKEDLVAFVKRVVKGLGGRSVSFCCELKIDGVALSLLYERGRFVHALTRGNGRVGDDVTANIKTIKEVPLSVSGHVPERMEVRGEVYLTVDVFRRLNEQREEEGAEPFANPRNAAAGSLKLLDAKIVAGRKLRLVCYSLAEGHSPKKSQYETLSYLRGLGFPVANSEYVVRANGVDEIWNFVQKVEHARSQLPFQIDGIVVKVDSLDAHEVLGVTGKSPRYAVAYKFAPEEAWTCVRDIVVQVGRTGVLTPVAELEPILLAGSVISRSTLHNAEEVARKDIRIGDTVAIEKGGDVIPKVTRVDRSKRPKNSRPWRMPEECPVCGSGVVVREGEVAVRCPNSRCVAQRIKKLLHFASKQAMNIEHIGESVAEQLVEKGLVTRVSDLYTLDARSLERLEGFKEKSIRNLLASIDASKSCSLVRFIMGLGIKYVGIETAELLAERVHDLDHFLELKESDLMGIEGIGEKTAHAIHETLRDPHLRDEIERLVRCGVRPLAVVKKEKGHAFSGRVFVLTGTLHQYTREEAADQIRRRGGRVANTVSKGIDYVLVGEDPGSKYERAKNLGITILSEEEFQSML